MHPMHRGWVLFAAILFLMLLTSSVAAQTIGEISGTVVAEDGHPVTKAHVRADIMDGEKMITGLTAQTDEHGGFVFSGLAFGKYRLSAEKREEGYLSTLPDLGSRPEISGVLTDRSPTFKAILRFEPKAGVISGWVKDAATGKPNPRTLESSSIQWAWMVVYDWNERTI